MHQFEVGAAGLNQFLAPEHPVETVEHRGGNALIDFETLIQGALQQGNHLRMSFLIGVRGSTL